MRKFLYCPECGQKKWCKPTSIPAVGYTCDDCGTKINLFETIRLMAERRKAARIEKAKGLGTYKSDFQKKLERRIRNRGEADLEYIKWIKALPCSVPGCQMTDEIDAHHAIHKSQGGSDTSCVPLCHWHHVSIYHGKCGSVLDFKSFTGVDLIEVSKQLRYKYTCGQIRKKS